MLFALLNGLVLKWPIPGAKDSPFAYFFINVNKYGWAFVGKWVVIIFIAYLLAGYVLYGIKNIKRNRLFLSKNRTLFGRKSHVFKFF